MWYHTGAVLAEREPSPSDYLFRHACEYAIAQGVDAGLLKGQKFCLADLFEAYTGEHEALADWKDGVCCPLEGGSPDKEDFPSKKFSPHWSGHRRLPGRRGSRPDGHHHYPGTAGCEGRVFWNPLPGGLESTTRSPRALRRAHLADPEPSKFANYIQALREARGDPGTGGDEWPRCAKPSRRASKAGDLLYGTPPRTLKAACYEKGGGGSLEHSRSLPALPKVRTHQPTEAEDLSSTRASAVDSCLM